MQEERAKIIKGMIMDGSGWLHTSKDSIQAKNAS